MNIFLKEHIGLPDVKIIVSDNYLKIEYEIVINNSFWSISFLNHLLSFFMVFF